MLQKRGLKIGRMQRGQQTEGKVKRMCEKDQGKWKKKGERAGKKGSKKYEVGSIREQEMENERG
jgi:hypothetical protein